MPLYWPEPDNRGDNLSLKHGFQLSCYNGQKYVPFYWDMMSISIKTFVYVNNYLYFFIIINEIKVILTA